MCVSETNNALGHYTSKVNKQTNSEKEIRFVVTRGGGRGRENWMKMVKRCKLAVKR